MFLMTISIPVMFGFIRSVGANANVGGLFGCEAGKFNTELLQVQTGYFLVEVKHLKKEMALSLEAPKKKKEEGATPLPPSGS